MIQSIITSIFVDVSFFSRLNALSKEYVVILDCSVLALGPWKYLASDKSFSCFSSRLPLREFKSDHNIILSYSVRCQVCNKENVTKFIELRTKEIYVKFPKLIF